MLNWSKHIEQIELGLFIAFILFFLIQIYYYFRIYFPVVFKKLKKSKSKNLPLSVIICARNEADNLQNNLKYVLEQDYDDFEVIVVNDCSTDETDEVLGEFIKKYKKLRVTTIPLDRKFSHGKKLAVTVGVKAARNEQLVFTDADCKPVSSKWLKELSVGFNKHEVVLGYGGYSRKKSLLNNYIRYDTLNAALSYFGFALAGIPYMGVGRNLAYKKTLFFKNKGFARNYGLISGDDDLFVNEVANKKNTTLILSTESFTESRSKDSWSDYFNQKVRHLSTSWKYKKKHVFMLGMEPVSRVWYYFLLILTLTTTDFLYSVIAIASFRVVSQLILYVAAGKIFKEKNLWLTCIIFDVISLFYNFVAYLALTLRSRRIKWK